MTDHDDDVARRYRALPREEPPAALDAAILAASRRAVAPRSSVLRRWSGPLSIAAVLMLAVGVVSRMQVEQPGVETSLPVPAPAAPDPVARPAGPPAPVAADARPAPKPAPRAKTLEKSTAQQPVEKREEPPPTPPPPVLAQAAPAAAPAQNFAPPAPAAAMTAKRMATDGAAAEIEESPEAMLERIAKLRAEGRHAEADRALEQFMKRYPDFRIPEATLQRVRRPTP